MRPRTNDVDDVSNSPALSEFDSSLCRSTGESFGKHHRPPSPGEAAGCGANFIELLDCGGAWFVAHDPFAGSQRNDGSRCSFARHPRNDNDIDRVVEQNFVKFALARSGLPLRVFANQRATGRVRGSFDPGERQVVHDLKNVLVIGADNRQSMSHGFDFTTRCG